MTEPKEAVLRELRALGTNEYESRAYLALLELGNATAYEIGKASGIPLSRSYEVARALVTKGLALTQPEKVPRYRAIAVAEAIGRRRDAMAAELAQLALSLDGYLTARNGEDDDRVWVARGQSAVLDRLRDLIHEGQHRITAWLPESAISALSDAIGAARERGVRIDLEPGGESVLVVCDARTAIVGEISEKREALVTIIIQPAVASLLSALAEGKRPTPRPPKASTEHTTAVPAETAPDRRIPPTDSSAIEPTPAWLAWEESKVRRLLATVPSLSAWDD